MPTLYGISISPFVRKVKVVLAEKNIEHDSVPMTPMQVDDEYRKKSPLGKIPCFQDGDFILPDSSCIIAYLDRTHTENSIYPSDPKDYARALWFEEFADTQVRDVCLPAFFERVVKTQMLQQAADEERVKTVLEEQAPKVFNYLEGELGDREWLVGDCFSIADIATASFFVNFGYGNEKVDASRWPKLAAYVERVHARPSFKAALEEDQAMFAAVRG